MVKIRLILLIFVLIYVILHNFVGINAFESNFNVKRLKRFPDEEFKAMMGKDSKVVVNSGHFENNDDSSDHQETETESALVEEKEEPDSDTNDTESEDSDAEDKNRHEIHEEAESPADEEEQDNDIGESGGNYGNHQTPNKSDTNGGSGKKENKTLNTDLEVEQHIVNNTCVDDKLIDHFVDVPEDAVTESPDLKRRKTKEMIDEKKKYSNASALDFNKNLLLILALMILQAI